MSSSNELRLLSTKWLTYSILGLALFSAGILVLMEAIVLRINGKDLFTWGWVLVVAIIIINAGISFIGTSIKYRIYLDRKRKQDNEFHTAGVRKSGHRHRHRHRSASSSKSKEHSHEE
jgi:hypothetical protein